VIAKRLQAWPALEQLELRETQVGDPDVAALRATGTRARIVVDKELPSRLAIDAIGSELELTRVNELEWAIWLDGARTPIRVRRRGAYRQASEEAVECAALEPIVRALWTGAPRRLRGEVITLPINGDHEVQLVIAPDRSEVRYER
jgi:hypothetical protein